MKWKREEMLVEKGTNEKENREKILEGRTRNLNIK